MDINFIDCLPIMTLGKSKPKCTCHYVFLLHFVFTIVISFSLHDMLPFLANKDEYTSI